MINPTLHIPGKSSSVMDLASKRGMVPFGRNFRPAYPVKRLWNWFATAIHDENVFVFLLGARWLSLAPPLLELSLRQFRPAWPCALLAAAASSNLMLSAWHPQFNRILIKHPVLLAVDLTFAALLLAASGGTASPYLFYALTPLLAAAFFFRIRGGLAAATAFTPLYLGAEAMSVHLGGTRFNAVEATGEVLLFYGIALVCGYPPILLARLREAYAETQRTHEELAHAQTLAAVGGMVARVSHEIRNPLTVLGGYAWSIGRNADKPTLVRQHAQVISDETKRLEELLSDMLDLTRPPKMEFKAERLSRILDQACLLSCGASEGLITIIKEYDANLVVEVHAASILRAFLNVVRNAIQFMHGSGILSITTRCEGDEAVVTITDTGPGIPPDVLPTIFQPFVTHRERGTGLGLSVTRQIIEQHGGRIEVESELGKGTRFTFYLPTHRG